MSAGRPRVLHLIRSGVLVLTFPAFAALSAAGHLFNLTLNADPRHHPVPVRAIRPGVLAFAGVLCGAGLREAVPYRS